MKRSDYPERGLSRRTIVSGALAAGSLSALHNTAASAYPKIDATFVFTSDIHACRMSEGLAPGCEQQGKTDANLLRHIAAVNGITQQQWPVSIAGVPTGLSKAGTAIAPPFGVIIGGDMTDDGGGYVRMPGEGSQLRQFSQRYQQGTGPDRIHFPVYTGLGNHDLDQDGPPPHTDWYRRELRDYVELNHRSTVFYKPAVPVTNYDVITDCYSWDWGGLHLVQLHRFGGDTRKAAISSLPWLKSDLAAFAGDKRPVIIIQHYGWDTFSMERWNPVTSQFDSQGSGAPHWWTDEERTTLLAALKGYNVVGLFHGHEHKTPLIYRAGELDVFKPKAAFLGGFAIVSLAGNRMDVLFAEANGDQGAVIFANAFSKVLN